MWESQSLESFWQDTRYAVRIARRDFGISALTILVLALGLRVQSSP